MGTALTLLGYLTGAAVFLWAARGRRLATEGIAWVALAGLVGGVLGAKGAEWALAPARPEGLAALDPLAGGRTILGGLFGGWLAIEAAKARLGIRRSTGDLFALALPAGEAVGRLGCFFHTCCHGTEATVPWAVFQHWALRHPAQLYAAAAGLLTLLALLWLRPRFPREGDLFRAFCLLFGLGRVTVEFFRERAPAAAGLSLAQWAALGLAVWAAQSLLRRGPSASLTRRGTAGTGAAADEEGGTLA